MRGADPCPPVLRVSSRPPGYFMHVILGELDSKGLSETANRYLRSWYHFGSRAHRVADRHCITLQGI